MLLPRRARKVTAEDAEQMMPSSPTHSFDVSLEEARRIQNELKACVQLTGVFASFEEVGLVGGADVAFLEFPSSGTLALAAAVVMEAGTRCVVETSFDIPGRACGSRRHVRAFGASGCHDL